ncbi:MAG: 3-hydroxyanthranilate 3,4-dioxygenase [Phycisphaerae bacterium]|nr:3-hydroxyanthranilate 3,4-dioxygenase [Phycisphaerae bacterium]
MSTAAAKPVSSTVTNPDTPHEPNGLDRDGSVSFPFNLKEWVEKNRHLMKPPVGNKYLYSGKDFFVMIIAGPNARNDFHMTSSEEFFYQIKGDVVIRVIDGGKLKDCVVREGDVFFVPPNVPHSPQRGPDTIGLVVERRRPAGETEHLMFFCEKCHGLVYDNEFDCKDIVDHFSSAMETFWADPKLSTCKTCGTRVVKPTPKV